MMGRGEGMLDFRECVQLINCRIDLGRVSSFYRFFIDNDI